VSLLSSADFDKVSLFFIMDSHCSSKTLFTILYLSGNTHTHTHARALCCLATSVEIPLVCGVLLH